MTLPAFTYCPVDRSVYWGTKRLSEDQCERLLDLFDELGEYRTFNELFDVHRLAGGIDRVSSLRAA